MAYQPLNCRVAALDEGGDALLGVLGAEGELDAHGLGVEGGAPVLVAGLVQEALGDGERLGRPGRQSCGPRVGLGARGRRGGRPC